MKLTRVQVRVLQAVHDGQPLESIRANSIDAFGLGRLIDAGLVKDAGSDVAITPKGIQALTSATMSPTQKIEILREALHATRYADYLESCSGPVFLSDGKAGVECNVFTGVACTQCLVRYALEVTA